MTDNRPLIQHYATYTVENKPLSKQHRYLRMFLWYQKDITSWSMSKELSFRAKGLRFKISRSNADCPYFKPWCMQRVQTPTVARIAHKTVGPLFRSSISFRRLWWSGNFVNWMLLSSGFLFSLQPCRQRPGWPKNNTTALQAEVRMS
jgi:hypothetical protein